MTLHEEETEKKKKEIRKHTYSIKNAVWYKILDIRVSPPPLPIWEKVTASSRHPTHTEKASHGGGVGLAVSYLHISLPIVAKAYSKLYLFFYFSPKSKVLSLLQWWSIYNFLSFFFLSLSLSLLCLIVSSILCSFFYYAIDTPF